VLNRKAFLARLPNENRQLTVAELAVLLGLVGDLTERGDIKTNVVNLNDEYKFYVRRSDGTVGINVGGKHKTPLTSEPNSRPTITFQVFLLI